MLLPDRHPDFAALQAAAQTRFDALGFPGRGHADWHYTHLDRLLPPTQLASGALAGDVFAPDIFSALLPHRLVFVDGVLDVAQSSGQTDIIKITPIANPEQLGIENEAGDAMLAANLAHLRDGVEIIITAPVEKPLEIIWLGSAAQIAAYGRVILRLNEGTTLTLIEHHAGAGVNHVVNQIALGRNAQLTHIKYHNGDAEQVGIVRSDVQLAENAKIKTILLCLNAALARHESIFHFNAAGSFADLASAIIASDRQHMDVTARLHHHVADTGSETIARSVLADKSCGVFQGKVFVDKNARHVDARQKTDALMLSHSAKMNAKPELEIYADDVICTHGSAIGEINHDAMFFLRSRGLNENQARDLLIGGFVTEILDRVPDESLHDILAVQLNKCLAALSFAKGENRK